MDKFVVFSDSSCDLPERIAKEHRINIIPLKVSFDRVTKLKEGTDISIDKFYERMQASPLVPKTYYPTVREYVNAFKTALDSGMDVLCLCLSSKLSPGYKNAVNAGYILSRAYKNNSVMVMDSLLAAGAQAALTLNAARLRDGGGDLKQTYDKLATLRDDATTIFTVSSLEQLARGGRMSKATAAMGTLLHINPIIHMENGELISREKAIGRAKAMTKLKQLAMSAINRKVNEYDITIFHSRRQGDAARLEADLKAEYGARWFNPTVEIGASIGSHTGVSVVALNCMKRV